MCRAVVRLVDWQGASGVRCPVRQPSRLRTHRCRATAGCNAWFYCEDDTGCVDWQTQRSIGRGFCILMTGSARPQPEPQYGKVKQPFDFFSYQAGYLKGGQLERLPAVP